MKNDSANPTESQPSPDRGEAIFHGALQLPPEQRADYIKLACGDDEPLRAHVESLLKANNDAGDFLDEPAAPSPNKTIALEIPLTEKASIAILKLKIIALMRLAGRDRSSRRMEEP